MSEPEHIDPGQLRPRPIRHQSLPPELLDQIGGAYDIIGRFLDTTLEQFEIGFMRAMHPESAVHVWCSVAAGWLAYHETYLGGKTLPDEEERQLLGALMLICTGVQDVTRLNVPVEVGRRLLKCYGLSGKG
jgi:hypothetical protein